MVDNVLLLSEDIDDNVKLRGNAGRARFENFRNRKVIGERLVDERCFPRKELEWIYQRGWKELATVERPCNVGWCREMMENFRSSDDDEDGVFRTRFRGTEVVMDRVRNLLSIPESEEDVEVPDGFDAMEFVDARFEFVTPGASQMELVSEVVCESGTVWTRKRCPKSAIQSRHFCLLESSFTNLYPGSGTEVSDIRAAFMYAVLKGWQIDIAAFIVRAWRVVAQSATSGRGEHKIPFPGVLCALATSVSPEEWPGVYREGRPINSTGRNRSVRSIRATRGAKRQKSATSSSASIDEDEKARAFRCEVASYSDMELAMKTYRRQGLLRRDMSYGHARLQHDIDSLGQQMCLLFQHSGMPPYQPTPFVYQPPVYPDFTPATSGPPTGSQWYRFGDPSGQPSSRYTHADDADDVDDDDDEE